jgi:hypothetical protein
VQRFLRRIRQRSFGQGCGDETSHLTVPGKSDYRVRREKVVVHSGS